MQEQSTGLVIEDAQQSDAASGFDTQSGVGSECPDEHLEETGGEATAFIDEINAKNDDKQENKTPCDEEIK